MGANFRNEKLWLVNTNVSKSFRSTKWRRIAKQAPLSVLGGVQAMYKMRGFLFILAHPEMTDSAHRRAFEIHPFHFHRTSGKMEAVAI